MKHFKKNPKVHMQHYSFPVGVLVFIILIAGSCKIGEEQVDRNLYEFNQEVTLSPVKETYNAGDIVIMSVSVPQKTFEDLESGETITVGNATFALNSRIETIDVEPVPQDSVRFDFILQDGEAEEGEAIDFDGKASLSYGCPETDYFLQFGYQFRRAGNYLIILNDLNVNSLIIFNAENDCSLQTVIPPPDDADQAFVQYSFADIDVNLDAFEEVVKDQNITNYSYYLDLLENKAAFFLRVR